MIICNHRKSDVKDSRPYILHGQATTKRRRKCSSCKATFTTFEVTIEKLASVASEKIQANIRETLESVCKTLYADSLRDILSDDFEANIVRQGTAVVRYLNKSGRKK